MVNVEEFLKNNHIEYRLHEHPAVYTCEEAEKYRGNFLGAACKNLFLQDKKGKNFFLVISPANKKTDLRELANITGVNKLTFASNETLKEKLGVESGAVSLFGLLNDKENEIKLYIDQEIWDADIVGFHPNINTATIELSHEMFQKFLKTIKNKTFKY